jgi:hypothetical protein
MKAREFIFKMKTIKLEQHERKKHEQEKAQEGNYQNPCSWFLDSDFMKVEEEDDN